MTVTFLVTIIYCNIIVNVHKVIIFHTGDGVRPSVLN